MKYSVGRIFREAGNILQAWRSIHFGGIHSRPISINLLVTDRCNSQCITCDIWKNDIKKKDLLTIDHFHGLAKEFEKMGVMRVTIGGGEPLLRKDLPDIIRIFADKGIIVQLTTHGLLCDSKMLKTLWDAGLNTITFSMDGHTPELYKKIRGVDWFEKIIFNLKLAIQTKPPGRSVETNTVILNENIDQLIDILDYAISIGVDGINISPLGISIESNLLKDSKSDLLPDMPKVDRLVDTLLHRKEVNRQFRTSRAFLQGMKEYFSNPNRISFPCYAGYVSADVYENGDVRGCGSIPVVGNIFHQSFQSIWNGEKSAEQRKDMKEGRCPGCYVSCKIEPSLLLQPRNTFSMGIDRIRGNE